MNSKIHSKQKPEKKRLDVLVVERGLAKSRQKAQAIILAGEVMVNGQKVDKAGAVLPAQAGIEILGRRMRYVSRGGLKLEGALEDFGIVAAHKICLDVGSSTGGFTDCLLQYGARRVHAVDVSVNQLAWKLQQDPRVVRIEHNARNLQFTDIGEKVDLVTIDLSFISVAKVLPRLVAVVTGDTVIPHALPRARSLSENDAEEFLALPSKVEITKEPPAATEFLILIKPQFELERKHIGKGGIVRDPLLHERAIERVKAAATAAGLTVKGVRPSRLAGAEGNQEFFLYARLEQRPGFRTTAQSGLE